MRITIGIALILAGLFVLSSRRQLIGMYDPKTGRTSQITLLLNDRIIGFATDYGGAWWLRKPLTEYAQIAPSPNVWHVGRITIQRFPTRRPPKR